MMMQTKKPAANPLLEIAERIREMREIVGYSEAEMAEKTEVSVEQYHSYEQGTVDFPFTFMHKCALAFGVDMPILLILIGIIYIVEILSVVLQVTYFKISHGKRIFKMAPIHHHFEMCGWNENKICFVFSGVTLFAGIIGVLLAVFGC